MPMPEPPSPPKPPPPTPTPPPEPLPPNPPVPPVGRCYNDRRPRSFACHVERSETSLIVSVTANQKNPRFFAVLRMTFLDAGIYFPRENKNRSAGSTRAAQAASL